MEAAALSPPDDEHDPEGSTVGFERALVIDLLSQPLGRDGPAARLAPPVGAGVEPLKGEVQGGDVGLGLAEQVDHQRPLEADGGAFGVVLVVGR
ncbi:MAG TPA: hypothetical protein VNT52_11530 [Acidimicrobiales bacterium]|nr:hypothetical protein [Acidimicrobiales bacterium]